MKTIGKTIIDGELSKALDKYLKNVVEISPDFYDFSISIGVKNIKIIMTDKNGSGRSVHSFINIESGDVLKPASWNSPAKGKRGNIFDEDNGRKALTRYGVVYLK